MHEFVRICSSNNGGSGGIILRTSGVGVPEFTNMSGLAAGPNISMEFALTGVNIYINNTLAVNAAMPSNTEFSNLFDLYMIDKVDICPWATYSSQGMAYPIGAGPGMLPFVCYAADDDDSSATGVTTLQQYDTCQYTNFSGLGPRDKLITIYPKYASQTYQTAVTTGYAPKRGFVNSTNSSVPHFGFKMALDDSAFTSTGATNLAIINFVFKYHLKLKGTI